MKCSKCGKRCNTLAAMAKHYRKKHPGAMKRGPSSKTATRAVVALQKTPLIKNRFCPHCGGFLGQ